MSSGSGNGDSVKAVTDGDGETPESSPFFYSGTAQPATSVEKSVVGHFTSPNDTNLLVAFVLLLLHSPHIWHCCTSDRNDSHAVCLLGTRAERDHRSSCFA